MAWARRQGLRGPCGGKVSTLVANHGEGIPREAGGGGLSRPQESGIYLTSVTAGPRCFNLCGCTGVSPSGHPPALCQHHCANTTPRTGFTRGRGRAGSAGFSCFLIPQILLGQLGYFTQEFSQEYLGPSQDPGQKLRQLLLEAVPGSLLQQPPPPKPTASGSA